MHVRAKKKKVLIDSEEDQSKHDRLSRMAKNVLKECDTHDERENPVFKAVFVANNAHHLSSE